MFWSFSDSKVLTTAIPLYVCGTTKDYVLILTTETGDALTNAYLALLDPNTYEIIQAKIGTGSFEQVGLLGQGSCWIGDVTDGESVTVTFRIALNVGFADGLYLPTVLVVSGDAQAAPSPFWTDDIDSYFTDTTSDFFA